MSEYDNLPEINSNELHTLLEHGATSDRPFAEFNCLQMDPMIVLLVGTGKKYLVKDEIPTVIRRRSIHRLLEL